MEPDNDKYSWYWISRGIAGVLILAGNVTVIYLISTRTSLHKIANWFVMSLACSDLGIGSIIVPASYICSFELKCKNEILKVCYNLLLYASVGNLCCLTVDRYVAIVYSLKYSSIMTRSKMKWLISLTWGVPAITSLVPEILKLTLKSETSSMAVKVFGVVTLITFEVCPCFLMIALYFHILIICRRHSRQMKLQEAQLGFNYSESGANESRSKIKEKSAFIAVVVVVSLFLICWTISTYRTFCYYLKICEVDDETTKVSRVLFLANAAADPFVWAFMKKDMRSEFLRWIQCRKYERRSHSATVSSVLSLQSNHLSSGFALTSSRSQLGNHDLELEREIYDSAL